MSMDLSKLEIVEGEQVSPAIYADDKWLCACEDMDAAKRIKRAIEDGQRTPWTVMLSDADMESIEEAIASCEQIEDAGECLAAIVREWLTLVKNARKDAKDDVKPTRTDNGDGTVTFVVPVTVRADVLEGRDVLAVKPAKEGEEYLSLNLTKVLRSGNKSNIIDIILGPKPQPPAPQFSDGGFYRNRIGQLVGPLVAISGDQFVWKANSRTYRADGSWHAKRGVENAEDLLPGEVIVWRHPGLKAGKYLWHGGALNGNGFDFIEAWKLQSLLESWTDPPRDGMWNVVEGQEYAEWVGE